ncbi:cytochrome P450 [Kibdelosporangium banguiense]|uniref:Cytochrome P450 n=1 Tax=Kibdelosporangium banguiense TaxID=1365924 RepID=A0ABS4TYG5_9PSEU|nr:cytochrome P450 [Kibdelosporangium banguiense]MBP2329422.1 cytochrome P450 [Kibdelosporangium banguiense]
MTDTFAGITGETAPSIPDYPMPRQAGCPFQPPAPVRQLTAAEPIAKVRIWDGSTPWIITRHADQRALLNDPRVSIDEKLPGFPHMTRGRADAATTTPPMVANTDAPAHTRLRRMVNGRFMVRRVEALRPGIQKITDELIDAMLAGPKPADLVTALGLPVPTLVISELLGAPYADHEFIQRNSNVAVSHSATVEQSREAGAALSGYLGGLIEQKMTRPADDMLSELAARIKAGEMTPAEAVVMAIAVLIAGHETSASMISLGTLALLQNPDQLAVLRDTDDPTVVAAAVEELLRYLSIVHTGVRRIAVEDIEIGDQILRAGDGLIFDLSAANWDAGTFPGPEQLDLSRAARQHQAFGYGPHQCLGQSLARVELQVVYGTLYRRVPTLRLATSIDEIEFAFEGIAYRLRSLPVTW